MMLLLEKRLYGTLGKNFSCASIWQGDRVRQKEQVMRLKFIANVLGYIFLSIICSGCASMFEPLVFEPDIMSLQKTTVPATKTAFIAEVNDKRLFFTRVQHWSEHEVEPRFGIPNERVLGSIHNDAMRTYGGHMVLPHYLTVSNMIMYAVQKGLMDNGYKILSKESEVTKETAIVNIHIDRCWGWAEVGAWDVRLTYEIISFVGVDKRMFEVTGKEVYEPMLGFTRNDQWETFEKAFNKFCLDAKQQFSTL